MRYVIKIFQILNVGKRLPGNFGLVASLPGY